MGAHAQFVLAQIAFNTSDIVSAREHLCDALATLARLKLWADCATCIDLSVMITAAQGDAEPAARLLAAADALYEREHVVRQPVDQHLIEPVVAQLYQLLSPSALEQLQRETSTLPPDQIVALALASGQRSTN
ncbi:MAG: hypothetical protein OHK0022_41730 [Roseiflexaceae bacterium]